MKRIATLCILVPIIFGSGGCVLSSGVRLDETMPLPPINPIQVRIYMKAADVPGEYEKVGFVFTEEVGIASTHGMLNQMRKDAARLGANGLILEYFGTSVEIDSSEEGVQISTNKKKARALAIFVKEN